MGLPSPVKIKKNGVEYVSSVDRVQYTLAELVRGALRDTGKLVTKRFRSDVHRRTGRLAKNTQYWVRRKSGDLQIGFKPGGFYGMYQEFGSSKTQKLGLLKKAVNENIDEIRRIQGKYLSAIDDENRALGLIDESEVISDD
ncbi:HK97-gp10 family putative phage morphogenesis protein [Bacillus sp. 2205SS5-2]|uniref:HK97-gp10 family putative phage morphogenesis protein n=1 Tax=Bacillus sp. 2205SS5-2 TaxID=3109031 RepID=UPI0030064277